MKPFRALAEAIGGEAAEEARRRFIERVRLLNERPDEGAADLAALLSCAYPALAQAIDAHPSDVLVLARQGTKTTRDARAYRRLLSQLAPPLEDEVGVRRALRTFARREKMRVAARELMPNAGSEVDITARELSDLADTCLGTALDEALAWAERRFGLPVNRQGARVPLVVIGMGKLGGRELNAGSDVDLIILYETDDGEIRLGGAPTEQTLHEYFTRVAQRFIATLEEATDDGVVWRVDMRLRPEGSRGPLVNAVAAAERYYETWGRTWERAALVRARPSAGDIAFGKRALDILGPFVWRRAVDPHLADEMASLVRRARAEMSGDPKQDLKLGPGGIREVEFFAQSLQLVWGGRDPKVRSTNTLDALRKLRARGLVTDREGREMADSYLFLRRLEHRVQFATGLQTHALPEDPKLQDRLARTLGFASRRDLMKDLDRVRQKVSQRFHALVEQDVADGEGTLDHNRLFAALDASDEPIVLAWLSAHYPGGASPDLSRHMMALARRPDAPLGGASRDRYPTFGPTLLEALSDAADPEQAARLLATMFTRLGGSSGYVRALAEDPGATRRLVGLFGASAFLGDAVVGHPELADRLLFGRGAPRPEVAREVLKEEIAALRGERDGDAFVGALRRAKGRVLMEVGLSDLAGELTTRDCTLILSALADATLEEATRYALEEKRLASGLAVIAMGKLGGREIGYGSDLDLFFVYDDASDDAAERYVRIAQRVLRLVSMPHGEGAGYELDTRLRPSGSQGLLVVSLDAFRRYHSAGEAAVEPRAEDWERQALLKARTCAGDVELGARVRRIAENAAYERGAPPPERVHHLRMRMERELAGERRSGRARYDMKLGRGGLVDVEFAIQWLQMKHGGDARMRTTDTESALAAAESAGYLEAQNASPLREGYRFLRRLEQRLRVLHGTSAQLLEQGAPGLAPLARRMGMRDGPWGSATDGLLSRYLSITGDVRAAYLSVLGLKSP